MKLLDFFTPKAAPKSEPKAARPAQRLNQGHKQASGTTAPRQTAVATNYFEALNESPDRTPLPAIAMSFKTRMSEMGREKLAAISQHLYDNVGPVGYTVDTIANYSVPIRPQPCTLNPDSNAAYLKYWESWCERCEFTGRFDFETLQRQMCKSIDIQADIGAAMVLENGFPQIQLFESWRISSSRKDPQDASKPKSVGGVRIDDKGRVLGYDIDSGKTYFSRNEFILVCDQDRYENYRSFPALRRGCNDIRDAQDIKAFEKLAAKVHASLVSVIKGGPIEEDAMGFDTSPPADSGVDGEAGEAANNPAPDSDASAAEKKLSLWDLLGGDIPVLPDGQELNQLDNTRQSAQVGEFAAMLVGWFVMGCGLPPAFIIDEKLTGPNQRAVNGKAQRKFDHRQADIARFVLWAWRRVIGYGIEFDGLPAEDNWENPEWSGPAKVTIDSGRETAQERSDVEARLMSRQNHFANRSLDWRRETDQQFHEDEYILERCTALAKKFGVPLEMILIRWGFTLPKPQPNEPTTEATP